MSPATNGRRTQLPEGWQEHPAGEILGFEYGKALPARNRRDGDVGVYASAGRVGSHDEALVEGPIIVVGRKGAAGNVFVAEGKAWVIDTAYYATVPSDFNIRFLAFQLQAADLVQLDQSTAIPSLSRDDLKRVTLRVPPRDEQDRIVEGVEVQLARLQAGLEALDQVKRHAERFRRAVLRQAVLGRPTIQKGSK